MGLSATRSGSRSTMNDVAYVERLLAGRVDAGARPRPGRRRPLRDRAQAVQLRLADLLQARSGVLRVELPRVRSEHHLRGHPAAQPGDVHDCAGPTQRNDSLWNIEGGPASSRACARFRPSPTPTSGTRTRTIRVATGRRGWARRARPTTRPARRARRRPARPPSARGCSPSSTAGGVGPHGMTQVQVRPGQPEPEEVPALLQRRGRLRRVDAGHAA